MQLNVIAISFNCSRKEHSKKAKHVNTIPSDRGRFVWYITSMRSKPCGSQESMRNKRPINGSSPYISCEHINEKIQVQFLHQRDSELHYILDRISSINGEENCLIIVLIMRKHKPREF